MNRWLITKIFGTEFWNNYAKAELHILQQRDDLINCNMRLNDLENRYNKLQGDFSSVKSRVGILETKLYKVKK